MGLTLLFLYLILFFRAIRILRKAEKTFGGLLDDEANSVLQTTDGGYALTGQTSSFGKGNYDFFFIKTDAAGNSSCHQTNIHSPKRIQKTIVTTSNALQSATVFPETAVHPIIFSGTTPTDPCAPIGISEKQTKNSGLRIFPNPNSGVFNLSFENLSGNSKINITSILGEVIYSASEQNSLTKEINLDYLSNGTYFIQVTSEGKSYTGKFLVNK